MSFRKKRENDRQLKNFDDGDPASAIALTAEGMLTAERNTGFQNRPNPCLDHVSKADTERWLILLEQARCPASDGISVTDIAVGR